MTLTKTNEYFQDFHFRSYINYLIPLNQFEHLYLAGL